MDIRSYFRNASKTSVVSSSSDSEDGNESEIDAQPNPPKKHCSSSTFKPPSKSGSGIRKSTKRGKPIPWLEFDENIQGAFSKLCKKGGRSLQRTGGAWITKPFTNWKKATQKMKSHSQSKVHHLSCQLDVEADRARQEGSIISQLQNVGEQQRLQNRKVIKVLIRCTHFLAHQHIAHTTNFDKLVELVVSVLERLSKPSLAELEEMQRTPQKCL